MTARRFRGLYLMPRVAHYLSTQPQKQLLHAAMQVVSERTTITEAKAPSPVKTQVKALYRNSLERVAAMEVELTNVESQHRAKMEAKMEDLIKAHREAMEKLREGYADEVTKLTSENRKLTNVVNQRKRNRKRSSETRKLKQKTLREAAKKKRAEERAEQKDRDDAMRMSHALVVADLQAVVAAGDKRARTAKKTEQTIIALATKLSDCKTDLKRAMAEIKYYDNLSASLREQVEELEDSDDMEALHAEVGRLQARLDSIRTFEYEQFGRYGKS